jgi:hypothetical protein
VALGLSDPLAAVSFSAMPISDLAAYHRGLVAAQREISHWRRLITARIDLAVAAVTDVEEPLGPPPVSGYGCPCTPPAGLRDLIGIPRWDQRLNETSLLMQLHRALIELTEYADALDAVTDEAAHILAFRIGRVTPSTV